MVARRFKPAAALEASCATKSSGRGCVIASTNSSCDNTPSQSLSNSPSISATCESLILSCLSSSRTCVDALKLPHSHKGPHTIAHCHNHAHATTCSQRAAYKQTAVHAHNLPHVLTHAHKWLEPKQTTACLPRASPQPKSGSNLASRVA